VGWFAGYLPGDLLLGDPGTRDALMHGNQVCVPDATLLPSGIERVHISRAMTEATGELRYCATERRRDGDTYIYDIAVRDDHGEVVERWEGLRLQAVRKGDGGGPWVAPLLGSYLEREVEERLGVRVAVAVEPDGTGEAGRRAQTELAAGRALGHPAQIRHRLDGRPELATGDAISASHGAGVTLCVVGEGTLGCDVEPVAERSPDKWSGLLNGHAPLAELIARELDESPEAAGTRVWSALECLRKAGLPADASLTLAPGGGGAWTVLTSGSLRIATLITTLRDVPSPVVFAVLVEGRS
jgi:enediyne polyketide synthase